jgi:immune inhibitor A
LILLAAWRVGVCVPALPENYRTFSQPDGTEFRAKICGDEFFNWFEDKDGYRIQRDERSSKYLYVKRGAGGAWELSEFEPGKVDPKTVKLEPGLPLEETAFSKRRASAYRARSDLREMSKTRAARSTGTLKNLVILANFSNTSTVRAVADFQGLFNTPGFNQYGAKHSVRDYFDEVSYGQLTLQSTVVGWITLPQDNAYYAGDSDNNGEGDGSFGVNFDMYPYCAQKMAEDAIAAVDSFVDFTQFDGDGDGWIDAIDIIHQGAGAEVTGNVNQIWSHFGALRTVYTTGEGIKIASYHTEPELSDDSGGITYIGAVCHETGHFFGLPDLYDYGMDSYGIGMWGLMGWGPWGDNGLTPVHLCAWSKKQLGWIVPYLLDTTRTGVALAPATDTPLAYSMRIEMPAREYFMVENRQRTGFDSYLPGEGMLIWHVDESREDNNDQNHYLVGLEQADGLRQLEIHTNKGDAGDPFPGSTLNRFFTESTTPNSNRYDGTLSYIRVKNIDEVGDEVVCDSETRAPYLWTPEPISYDGSYDVHWTQSLGAASYVLQEGKRSAASTFIDDAEESLDNWSSEGFERTTARAYGGSYSFYSGTGESMEHRIELARILQPRSDTILKFWRYYGVNDDGDGAYLELAREGRDWEVVRRYVGSQRVWTLESISLAPYVGELIRIRFRYATNKGSYGEGFYFDDVTIENAVEIQWSTVAGSLASSSYAISGKQGGIYWYRVAGINGATEYPWSNMAGVDVQVSAAEASWSLYH